jgi:Flp pilus assembly protein CpaB
VQRAFVSEFDTVEVPVPERPVLAGTLVKDIPLRMESFAEHQIPRGSVRDLGVYRDAVVLAALPGGLPIPEVNLGNVEDATNPVVGKIPPGMRAMAIRVDATASVEGWARSGSVVDVLLVEKNRTIVVAEKVRVLSTENSVSPVNEQQLSPTPSTVTLLVTQEQCLAINTAAPMGKIAFALRGTRDGESWKSTEFSSHDLAGDVKGGRAQLKIAGVATFRRGDKDEKFALIDGAWIPADSAVAESGREPRVTGVP